MSTITNAGPGVQEVRTPLTFPVAKPPLPGTAIEIADGILWTQFALPFVLNHVNVYLIRDGAGWAVVDTGIGDERTFAAWRTLVAEALNGAKLTRLIVTHFHPDHIGAGSWLIQEYGLPLHMTRSEYLYNLVLHRSDKSVLETYREFYTLRGMSPEQAEAILKAGHDYVDRTAPMPPVYHALADGDVLDIGGRPFEVLTGTGHSWDQLMLLQREANVLVVADQVLPKISPNISVVALEPNNDPLGAYLKSIARLARDVPRGVLALPGHRLPFYGLHERIDELTHHHAQRCDELVAACREAPLSAADLVPILFFAGMDTQQTSFAFCEIIAHLNYLVQRDRMAELMDGGILKYRSK
jgi:glyoxylase-like metal-dependent hydrolase (beta-lactamase superfamily II)